MAATRRFNVHADGDAENHRISSKPTATRAPTTRGLKPRTALSSISNHASVKQDKNSHGKKPGFTKSKSKSVVDLRKTCDPIAENVLPIKQEDEIIKTMDIELDALLIEDQVPEGTGIEDIDADDYLNPQLCAEYVKDVYKYLRRLEKKFQVKDYLHKHTDINERMRSILVDWLIQVHSRFNLLQETIYLTVYIIDQYLSVEMIERSKLQLLGVTAMLLASKYEESYAPEIADFVYITDNAYTTKQIRQLEHRILEIIEFDLSHPLCLHFLRRNSKAGMADARKHTLAKYFMELSLVDYQTARVLPSCIAAAALCLSQKLIDGSEWCKTLEHYTTYSYKDIEQYVKKIANLVVKSESSKCQAVKSKYSSSKFMKVSSMTELRGEVIRDLSII